jgi:hypothetical protein
LWRTVAEARRYNAYHGVHLAIELQLPPKNARSATEETFARGLTQEDDVMLARCVLLRLKGATDCRLDREYIEEMRGDFEAAELLRLARAREV